MITLCSLVCWSTRAHDNSRTSKGAIKEGNTPCVWLGAGNALIVQQTPGCTVNTVVNVIHIKFQVFMDWLQAQSSFCSFIYAETFDEAQKETWISSQMSPYHKLAWAMLCRMHFNFLEVYQVIITEYRLFDVPSYNAKGQPETTSDKHCHQMDSSKTTDECKSHQRPSRWKGNLHITAELF